jgi:hypothetical protein
MAGSRSERGGAVVSPDDRRDDGEAQTRPGAARHDQRTVLLDGDRPVGIARSSVLGGWLVMRLSRKSLSAPR